MAIFYLLPPRPVLEDSLGRFLSAWLPGLHGSFVPGGDLVELLQSHLDRRGDVFVVFREDLPDGVDAEDALRAGFGAESGDDVVELHLAGGGQVRAQSWRLGAMAAA